jgi:ribosomal protein S18 acetylase RimI-like enzyme
MKTIDIKKIGLESLHQLQSISALTFCETFGSSNNPEDLELYLHNNLNADKLLFELSTKDSEFYLAIYEGKVIGYLKLNFKNAQTENHDPEKVELERLYVLQEFHGEQIGYQLMQFAIETVMQRGLKTLWLGVWENNLKAITFYKKLGFVTFGEHCFKLGNDNQRDLLMSLSLYN